jgi:hypothetical protein
VDSLEGGGDPPLPAPPRKLSATPMSTPAEKAELFEATRGAAAERYELPVTYLHSVWGRVLQTSIRYHRGCVGVGETGATWTVFSENVSFPIYSMQVVGDARNLDNCRRR